MDFPVNDGGERSIYRVVLVTLWLLWVAFAMIASAIPFFPLSYFICHMWHGSFEIPNKRSYYKRNIGTTVPICWGLFSFLHGMVVLCSMEFIDGFGFRIMMSLTGICVFFGGLSLGLFALRAGAMFALSLLGGADWSQEEDSGSLLGNVGQVKDR